MASRRGFASSGLASEAGKKGGATLIRRLGPGYFRRIGKMGGEALKASGVDYAELGRRGAAKRWGKRNGSEPRTDGS